MKLLGNHVSASADRASRRGLERARFPCIRSVRRASILAIAAGALALAPGCAMMPAGAPTAGEVENNQRNEANSIVVVDIDAQVIAALSAMTQ